MGAGMPTKPLKWPENLDEWPAQQSNAASDRDDAAIYAMRIIYLARDLQDKAADNGLLMPELIYRLSKIDQAASDICRLMERNGAPTRPYLLNGKD